jgi:SAM-dependent methyltransferase
VGGETTSVDDPKRIIEEGYDRIGSEYRRWSEGAMPDDVREEYVREVLSRLSENARVLELGCGAGVDAVRLARAAGRYTGIDLSGVQLATARGLVPDGTFLQGDFTTMDFPDESFHAVVSFLVFNHVPAAEQGPLFHRTFAWLRPSGFFCVSLGAGRHDDMVEADWLGVPMFFASNGREENERLLCLAGFDLERSELRAEPEDDDEVTFHWVIARKPR